MSARRLVLLIPVTFVVLVETASASKLVLTPPAINAPWFFEDGVAARGDAAVARQRFAQAAEHFDRWWMEPGSKSPALAVNRGRAHFLAGNMPQAIRAFRDGLDLYPWDADLQRALTAARATVAYPTETSPAERVRPDPPNALRNRVSPWDLFLAASACSLLLTVGLARRLTARDGWSTPLALVGLLGLLTVAAAGTHIATDRPGPVLVLTADEVLRTGNGAAFPARTAAPLPRGAEVRQLARRGGWVQVELPGGAVGWVREPEGGLTTEAQRHREDKE
jgi:tetratricopeptide (TPR) repeat protein